MKYSIPERQERAEKLHNQGYNCAQCVMMVFDDLTSLDETIATRMLAGFGAGMGKTREVCGTLTAAASLRGMLHYGWAPQIKSRSTKRPLHSMINLRNSTAPPDVGNLSAEGNRVCSSSKMSLK